MSPFSTTRYESPSRAATSAAESPAGPAPMIRRSSRPSPIAFSDDSILARRAPGWQTRACRARRSLRPAARVVLRAVFNAARRGVVVLLPRTLLPRTLLPVVLVLAGRLLALAL